MDTTAELDAWLAEVEREADAIRGVLGELEGRGLPPTSKPASELMGREVGVEETREVASVDGDRERRKHRHAGPRDE